MKKIIKKNTVPRIACLMVMCLSMSLFFAGCSKEAQDASELVIGFSQLGSESAWRLGNTASMEKAAEDHGFNLVVDNGMQKQENQIAAIRSFISYQVDVIVFAPIVESGWANVLQEAKDAGIPVIMMDRVINVMDSDLYTAYIGPDHYQEGVNAAKFLMKKAEEMLAAEGTGAQSITKSGAQSITESGAQSITKSGAQSITESGAQSITESDAQSITESDAQSITESDAQSGTGSGAQTSAESGAQSITESASAKKIRIVEISGTEGSSPMISRYQGFHDLIDRDGRFEVLETISGDFLRSKGKECMETLLKEYPDQIDVIYSHNDAMTLGAIEVLEAHKIAPGKDVVIISVDGEQAAVDLLKEGKINCVVECSPMLGEAVMDLAEKIVSGQEYPRISRPEEGTFTEYDDLSRMEPRGY